MRERDGSMVRVVVLAVVLGLVWAILVAAVEESPPAATGSAAASTTLAAVTDPEAAGTEEPAAAAPPGEEQPPEVAEPADGEPAAGDPDAEQPAEEDAAGEEPVAGEPDAGEPAEHPAEESPAVEEPSAVVEAAEEDPNAEEPDAEPPAATEPADGEPLAEVEPSAVEEPADEPPAEEPDAVAPAVVEPAVDEEPPPGQEPPAEEPVAEPPAATAAADPTPPGPRAVSLPTTITTRKATNPSSANTSFPFTVTGPAFNDSFSLVDGGTHTSTLPGGGSYTLAESVPGGWGIVGIDCTNGSVKQSSGGAASITLTVVIGERWDCTVTDQQLATIVIAKSVDFDDDTTFGFGGDLGDFTVDPAGLTGSQTFTDVDPTLDYEVSETVPAGWDLTFIECSDESTSSTTSIVIDPFPGGTTTCTFTNEAQEGTITVVKEASPADGTDFSFTIEAGRLPTSFELDDDADPTLPDRESFDRLPGTWTVAEQPPFGWEVAGIACSNGQSAGNGATSIDVVLAPGGEVTCTFTNRKLRATIVIEKSVDFDDDTAFEFGGDLGDFAIDPDGTTGSKTFPDLDPDQDYEVSEIVPAGWDLTFIECSDESTSSTDSIVIDPFPGGTTTCTFTNRAQEGTITVVKVADPVDGTEFEFSGDLGEFSLTAETPPPPPDDGGPEDRAQGRSVHQQTFTVEPGAYDIVEELPPGWVLRSAACEPAPAPDGGGVVRAATANGVAAVVGPGQDVTCTFGNVKLARLTIAKDADPADGTEFPITVSVDAPGRPGGGQVAAFSLAHGDSETLTDLEPGRYEVAESLPAGWGLAGADCVPAPGPNPGTIVVTVVGGADVTCTLRNRQVAEIVIAKQADVADGTLFPFGGDLGSFNLVASPEGSETPEARVTRREGGEPEEPIADFSIGFTVDPGTFIVTEGDVPGWQLSEIRCRGGSTSFGGAGPRAGLPDNSVEITAAAGDSVECTFVNEAQPGSLTIVKEAVPADGAVFAFTFQPGTESEQGFVLEHGASVTIDGLTPATYRVVEIAPDGWGVGGIDCGEAETGVDAAAGTVDVDVRPGEDVTCVFRNTRVATVTIVKKADPPDGTDFGFAGDLGEFTLDDEPEPPIEPGDGEEEEGSGPPPQPRQGEEDLPDRMTFEVPGGTYTVRELVPEHWRIASIDCGQDEPPPPPTGPDPRAATFTVDLGEPSVTIDASPGDTIVCVFRNRARPVPVTIVKETFPDTSQPFRFDLSVEGNVESLDVRSGEPQTQEVDVGRLTISELPQAGWGLRSVECSSPATVDRAAGTATLDLVPGRAETCTFVNARTALITIRKQASPLVDTGFGFDGPEGSFTLTVPAPETPVPPPDDGGEEEANALGPAPRQSGEEGEAPPSEATFEVEPGTYVFSENATPGWELVAIACSGLPTDPRPDGTTPRAVEGSSAATDVPARAVTITVEAGDVVECGFENRQTERGLTIVKKSVPADGTDFSFTIVENDGRGVGFTLDDDADPTLPNLRSFEVSGGVTVTEAATPGWRLSSLDCDVPGAVVTLRGHVPEPGTGGGDAGWVEIELPAGAAATCTFTNTKLGSVTVIKAATPADATDFPFTLTGPAGSETLTLDAGAVTVNHLGPGAYTLAELVPAGWALRDVSCTGADGFTESGAAVEFELAPGGNVICTFDDVKLGSLEGDLFLDLNGDGERGPGEPDLADVEVRALWAGFDGEFGTGDDEEFTTRSVAGNSYRFGALPPGKHRVTAGDPGALVATRAVAFEIELAPGEAAQGAAFAFAGADLELTVVASAQAVRATQPFLVTVTVFNRGPEPVTGAAARVEVSPGLRVDEAAGAGAFDVAAGRWDIGSLASGSQASLVLTLTPQQAGDTVQVEAEVSASSLLDPDSTPGNDDPAEDDQDSTQAFTVGVAPAELLPVTGLETGDLVPPGLLFLVAGLVLVAVATYGLRRREDDVPPRAPRHPLVGGRT